MIDGVLVTPLKNIIDERGCISHFFKNTDSDFNKFGEIYFSHIMPGAIKAWHCHKEMDLNYCVVAGKIKLVLYDSRDGSFTRGGMMELFLGPQDHKRVHVPHGVWNGFKGIHTQTSIVANMATIPHNVDEIVRMSPFDSSIKYDWGIKHG